MRMKSRKLVFTVLFVVLIFNMNVVSSLAAQETVFSKIDATSVPYSEDPDTYLITSDASISWKYFNHILGYNDAGISKESDAVIQIFENRSENVIGSELNYSWEINGKDLFPITEDRKGPIDLGIEVSPMDKGVMVSFATTRVFEGEIAIKLNVSDYINDGSEVSLMYIDGVDHSQIHGSDTNIEEIEPLIDHNISVNDGFIEFHIHYGGNYSLLRNAEVIEDEKLNEAGEASAQDLLQEAETMNKLPKTGGHNNLIIYIMMIVVLGSVLFYIKKESRRL